ncbi:hypothetical protein F5884DRAFT_830693 [Xylogone sp. PMI_703]|nr:hypothetical protein F5884DRAFT_830693 [Xylogone sp. PMI_703]
MSDSAEAPQVYTYNDAPELCRPSSAPTKPLVPESYAGMSDPPEKSVRPVDRSHIVLQRTTFWALIISLVVLFAAAIGGSVGAALGTKAHDNSSKSETAPPVTTLPDSDCNSTSHNSTSTILVPQTSCPNSNGTIFRPSIYSDTSQSFRIECNVGYTNSQNIVQVMAYTLEHCITACATYNFWNLNRNCTYAAYDVTKGEPGNCWLEHGDPGPKLDSTKKVNTTYILLQE